MAIYISVDNKQFSFNSDMDKCSHNANITKICTHAECFSENIAVCDTCLVQQHMHSGHLNFITLDEVNNLMKKYSFHKKVKPDCMELQELFFKFFKGIKEDFKMIIQVIDEIWKNVVNRIGFPYLYQNDIFDTYKRIKSKDYKKIKTSQFHKFISMTKSIKTNQLSEEEGKLYIDELKNSFSLISKMENMVFTFHEIADSFKLDTNINFKHRNISTIEQKLEKISIFPTKEQLNIRKTQTPTNTFSQARKKQLILSNIHVQNSSQKHVKLQTSPKIQRKDTFSKNKDHLKKRQTMPDNKSGSNQKIREKSQKGQEKKKLLRPQIKIDRKIDLETRRKRRSSIDSHIKPNNLEKKAKKLTQQNKKERQKSQHKNHEVIDSDEYSSNEIKNNVLPITDNKLQIEHVGKEKVQVIPVKAKLQDYEMKEAQLSSPLLKRKKQTSKSLNSSNSPYLMQTSTSKHKHQQFTLKPKKIDLPELKQNEEKSFQILTASLSLNTNKAIPLLQKALQECSNNLSAGEYLSYLYLQVGKYKNCHEICQYFLNKIGNSQELKQDRMLLINNRAAALNHLGRYSETIKLLQSFLQENDLILKNLAYAYFQLGKIQDAIPLYKKIVEDSGDEECFYNLSACYYLKQEYSAAKFAINSALSCNPQKQEYLELQFNIKKMLKEH